jgi:hypothetical protein
MHRFVQIIFFWRSGDNMICGWIQNVIQGDMDGCKSSSQNQNVIQGDMDGCWIHSDIHVPMFPLAKMHVLELYMHAWCMGYVPFFSGVLTPLFLERREYTRKYAWLPSEPLKVLALAHHLPPKRSKEKTQTEITHDTPQWSEDLSLFIYDHI